MIRFLRFTLKYKMRDIESGLKPSRFRRHSHSSSRHYIYPEFLSVAGEVAKGLALSYGSKKRKVQVPDMTPQKPIRKNNKIMTHHDTEMGGVNVKKEISNQDGVLNVVAAISGGHKKIKDKRKRGVHVSKSFKAKVLKVEEEIKYHGWKIDVEYRRAPAVAINTQSFANWDIATATVARPGFEWSFLPQYFWNAATVLWGAKVPSLAYLPNDTDNIGAGVAPIVAAGTSATNATLFIKDSYESYLFRNNSNRGCTIKLYEFAPKKKGNYSSTVYSWTNINAAGADTGCLGTPQSYWAATLLDDFSAGQNIAGGVGPVAMTVNTMGADPRHNRSFKAAYATDLKTNRTPNTTATGSNSTDWCNSATTNSSGIRHYII